MQIRRTLALATIVLSIAACKRTETPATATKAAETNTTAQTSPETSTSSTNVGAAMPEYTAMNLDGSKFDLAAKRDKVVLLNVWATWCGPCRYEIPELQQLHERYAAKGLEVIGVSVDESGVESVRDFVNEQKKMTYPIVLDAEGKIANLLQTSVLPTSVIVDRAGKIVWKKYGAIMPDDAELQKALDAAL
ncbi:MAG TPA: TlpA disulfide reductase family protein [Thermoanaerobaculia bacterium]